MTNQAIAQRMRFLNNRALKNNWNYEDVENYLTEIGLFYECNDTGDGWKYYYVCNLDGSREWSVKIELHWSDEDISYLVKQNIISRDEGRKASEEMMSRPVANIKVVRI